MTAQSIPSIGIETGETVTGLGVVQLTREHLQQSAILYVRQSTGQQLRDHQQSTARQYQLTERLLALGWPQEKITIIDEDLGISGSGKAMRTGFRRLLKLVPEQQVGIVLGLEMSRLDDGLPQFDPDVSAQPVMKIFFELF